jgi:hypothetical protein
LTKRKTKAEIRDEARAAWLAENADDLTPRLGEQTVNHLADKFAQAAADEARPTLSQRAERRKRDELEPALGSDMRRGGNARRLGNRQNRLRSGRG